jgi:hypothetical protein
MLAVKEQGIIDIIEYREGYLIFRLMRDFRVNWHVSY